MEEKKTIRKELKEKRDSLNFEEWNKHSKTIEKNIIKSDIYKESDCIMCYSDFNGEVGTLMIIEDALLSGKKVYLPKVLDNFTERCMEFYEIYSSNELIKGFKGILEPTGNRSRTFSYDKWVGKKILMLVPGVAFSREGYRIGYGMGYYDIYLKDKPEIIKCGLCFDMQMVSEIPAGEHDIKMDFLVNENTTLSEINKISKQFLR